MNKIKPAFSLALLVILGIFFHNFAIPEEIIVEKCLNLPTEVYSEIDRRGKLLEANKLESVFTPSDWQDIGFPVIDSKLATALQNQLKVLESGKFKDGDKIGNLRVNYDDLKKVIEILLHRANSQPDDLHHVLVPYQIHGDDRRGNVYFTGYFTPTLKVKKNKDSKYKYPLYAYPKDWEGQIPRRKEIDGKGALNGKGLELAYASNPVDIYIMQLQGSGVVEFAETGERMMFKYAGENGHPYRNIERFFRKRADLSVRNVSPDGIRRFLKKNPHLTDSVLFYNPSYTFFEPAEGEDVKGAGQVSLIENVSVAADPRYLPLGSVALAALPVYKGGKVTHHEYKILIPQDVGGAIRGTGRIDVYCGKGNEGKATASSLHHYGRLWILLPKNDEQTAMNM